MKRALDFVIRNWPLKVGALALAMVLYASLVVSQNARAWPAQVPIEPLNQPAGAFLLEDPGVVTFIRLYAPPDVASQLSSQDFSATIDLAGQEASVGGTPVSVPVRVVALDPRIQVIDFRPRQVTVRLDPVVSKTVPVAVDHGTIPPGLDIGVPQLVPATVSVRGASTLVGRVSHAVARVIVDPNGINVDADVSVLPMDDRNEVVAPVDVSPDLVHVRIEVAPQAATRSLPVAPQVTGSLPVGYQVSSVAVTPGVVTVTGDPQGIATLQAVPTAPLDISRQTADVVRTVALAPPAGVTVLGPTSAQVTVRIAAQRGSETFSVGLTISGARADRGYRAATASVLVTLGGSAPTLAAIDGAGLSATLDVSGLDTGTHTVPVTFRAPSGTTLVSLAPATVSVVVTVAPSPSPTP